MGQPISGNSDNQNAAGTAGVFGTSEIFNGVRGITTAEGHGAVVGINDNHTHNAGPGVYGKSDGAGVWGESETWTAVYGASKSTTGGAGVHGYNENGTGVYGQSQNRVGIFGKSETFEGIHAETNSKTSSALVAYQLNTGSTAAALYAKHIGAGPAGVFEGKVFIKGMLVVNDISFHDLYLRITGLEEEVKRLRKKVLPTM